MKKYILFSLVLILALGFVNAGSVTIRPDGQGYYAAWTNSGCSSSSEWQCVNEVIADTNNTLYTNSKGKAESFTFQDTSLTTGTINSVTLSFYGTRYNANRYAFLPLIRSSSIDYTGATKILGPTYAYHTQSYTNNPATGSAWTIAEVNALEAGMKSGASNYGGIIAQVYAVVDYTIPNSCNDTDFGYVINVPGTVSGYLNETAYSYSDYCLDNSTIMEYMCFGDSVYNWGSSCATNTTSVCYSGRCI